MREAQQLDVARVQISAAVRPFDDVISDDALRWRGASGPLASIAAFPLDAGDQRTPFARRVELLRHLWRGLHPRGEASNEGSECLELTHAASLNCELPKAPRPGGASPNRGVAVSERNAGTDLKERKRGG